MVEIQIRTNALAAAPCRARGRADQASGSGLGGLCAGVCADRCLHSREICHYNHKHMIEYNV